MSDNSHRTYTLPDQIFFYLCFAASVVVLTPMLVPLGAGLVLGFVSERPVGWMIRRAKIKRPIGRIAAVLLFMTLVLSAFLIPIGLSLYSASKDVIAMLSEQLSDPKPGEWIGPTADKLMAWVEHRAKQWNLPVTHEDLASLGPRLRAGALAVAGMVARSISGLVQGTPRALFDTSIVLFTWGVMALDGRDLRARILPRLIPWPRQRGILCQVTAEVLYGLIVANILVSAVQAVVCTLALGLFRVPRFFLWGVLTFFLSFVPVIGTTVVTLGAATYLFSVGRIGAGLGMLVIAVVVGSVDNILRPLFMQGSVQLSFFGIFIALVGGLATFGVAGSVLGPLFFSLCVAALRALEQKDSQADALPRA